MSETTWIGLSGAVPEIEVLEERNWSELGTRLFVSRLASRVFARGQGVVYGSHPTFVPLVEEAARRAGLEGSEGRRIQMFVARHFLCGEDEVSHFEEEHGDLADVVFIGARDDDRNVTLTMMRREMVERCDALVCVGGKLHRKDGHPPGVDEEARLAVERGIPVYFVGCGGGRSQELFEEGFLESSEALHNGLSDEENRCLARTEDLWEAVALVIQGLRAKYLFPQAPGAISRNDDDGNRNDDDLNFPWSDAMTYEAPMKYKRPMRYEAKPAPADSTLDHLKMIQDVISRLAGNSFSLKGWSLTLTAAVIAFTARTGATQQTGWFGLAALVPIIFFWGLDGYYLMLERRYRRLYEAVRQQGKCPPPPGAALIEAYVMDPSKAISGEIEINLQERLSSVILRPVVLFFHGGLLAAVLISMWLLAANGTPKETSTSDSSTGKPAAHAQAAPPPDPSSWSGTGDASTDPTAHAAGLEPPDPDS